MTDEEILARLPHLLHPYFVRPLALRLLRPVKLDSPEFHFAVKLLFLIESEPEKLGQSRWAELTRDAAKMVDPLFIKRCQRIVQHAKAKIEWRTALLLKRLDQTDSVFRHIEEDGILSDG